MTATVDRPPTLRPEPGRTTLPWPGTLASGLAVLLAGAPVSAVVQGTAWFGHAVTVVAVVALVGLLLHRAGVLAVATAQSLAILVLLTALFTGDGVLGLLPGPAAFGRLGALVAGAGQQIDTGTAPVASTPEILLLVTAAFGVLAVGVHLAAVGARAPAAAGVPLLAVFAVPSALADDLLPWWAMAAAAAGFGLLLVVRDGARRQLTGGATLVAGAVVIALGLGAVTSFVGTAGRFESGSGGTGGGGSIGLSPFTALRGQLEQTDPVELFRVRGLTRPSYLRALTLSDYVPETGWRATTPAPGGPLPASIRAPFDIPGDVVDVQVQNVGFRDYWLPLYGVPLAVSDLPDAEWIYDPGTGTAYTARPRDDEGWRQQALLPSPTAAGLRAADGRAGVGPEYLDTAGVDERVAALAQQVTAGAGTTFDRAFALQQFFTGPGSAFRYELQTAPGGGDDALVEFLTVGRVGYCEQFASAMAVMLRTVGVPARVAVGFTAGTAVADHRSISTSDAHAWVEAWFPGVGWTTFDPTPLTDGRAITPTYVREAADQASGAAGESTADDTQLPGGAATTEPTPAPADTEQSPPADQRAPADTGGGIPLWPFAVVLVALAAALVPAGLRVLDRRRRLAAVATGGPGAAGQGWAELLAESADRGIPVPATDTVRGGARRLVREHRLDADAQESLRALVAAVEASWYGTDDPGTGPGLAEPLAQVRTGIAAGTPLTLRQRVLPRSVLHRLGRPGATAAGRDRAGV